MNLSDRFKAALEALVTRISGKYDYSIAYACKVISQNGDGTLELQPDSSLLPGMSNVPIRYGAPGQKATVGAGARCFVIFENADPSKPVVAGWDVTSPLVLLTLGGGTQPIGRLGDLVQSGGAGQFCTISLTVPAPGTPGGLPVGSFITGYISFGATPPLPDTTGISAQPLYGVIATGSGNVQG